MINVETTEKVSQRKSSEKLTVRGNVNKKLI